MLPPRSQSNSNSSSSRRTSAVVIQLFLVLGWVSSDVSPRMGSPLLPGWPSWMTSPVDLWFLLGRFVSFNDSIHVYSPQEFPSSTGRAQDPPLSAPQSSTACARKRFSLFLQPASGQQSASVGYHCHQCQCQRRLPPQQVLPSFHSCRPSHTFELGRSRE